MSRRILVWFRSDLRTADHPALHEAAATAERGVVALFVSCPEQWREHDWGEVKVDFLARGLAALSRRLGKLGIPLLLAETPRFAGVPDLLLEVARRHDCDAVFFNRELEFNERRRDAAATRRLSQAGLTVRSFADQTIVEPGSLLTGGGTFYTVYTPFRRAWMQRLLADGGPRPLPPPRRRSAPVCAPDAIPARLPGFAGVPAGLDPWPAGEEEAERRLARFTAGPISAYRDRRDLPGEPGTSALSPYLALGMISPRTCLAAAMAANRGEAEGGDAGAVTWIQELVWREFYRHVLVGFERVSKGRPFQLATETVAWRRDEPGLERWRQGLTGVPIVDAGMRQLLRTGWMHNRLRMITAMFLSKDLLLDWRLGERHFMRHLVDGDLASNNGGWQWSASTGTDAAPYFRIFNPWSQGRRFDPDGRFIRRFLPELATAPAAVLHDPAQVAARRALGYPAPLVDHAVARERAIAAFARRDRGFRIAAPPQKI